tara:strand:- start:11842 stop:12393 length:552 start_codon:yes stop_codon:yes gene_type:complete
MDLTGKILVSMPNMLDERFHKAVIYICAHSKEGAMGIIINKQIDLDLYPDLLKQLGIDKQIDDKKIYIRYGGPLETSRGFVLHSDDNIQKDSLQINDGVALTNTSNIFNDFVTGKGPKVSILALGYSGWAPGQLEIEIKENSWLTLDVSSNFIFNKDVLDQWNDAYKILGIKPENLSNISGKA